jgi:hypothetical protein
MGFNKTIKPQEDTIPPIKNIKKIVNAPFYVSNLTIHNDQKVPFVSDLASFSYQNSTPRSIYSPILLSSPSASLPFHSVAYGGTGQETSFSELKCSESDRSTG